MKAIITKYHGPTNYKGSRITASDEDGNRITISYPYELSGEDVHRKAAEALCEKMNWKGGLIGGSLKNGYVFTFIPTDEMLVSRKLYNSMTAENKDMLNVLAVALDNLSKRQAGEIEGANSETAALITRMYNVIRNPSLSDVALRAY